MPDETELAALTRGNRLMIADVLAGLDDAQWQAPSLCAGWTVGTLAAHLLQPMLVGFGQFVRVALRHRGDTNRTVDHLARQLAGRPRSQTVEDLRRHAADRTNPPRVGPIGPFAETCIHLRDIARPLALSVDVPAQHWRLLLTHLVAPRAARALIVPGTTAGLRLRATDTDWEHGAGTLVTGPAEALGMALTGRPAALADLDGPGVARLAARIPTA
ncbi:maleylpyruvate isomerase family mycothiol-dependent enzyme [Frankia sp. AgB32]|uniref:maleylpyruvate isomerase family mycothiol-dependent enzyme n=1 Tax=Frankia sp. AgB32 TaxID=631119 RepID=UPI00200EC45E|nr:maleylpyruvate isomerase family mycothiol-dependent enzyme [Frankia sp. AgB32]MCK9895272.1 maleylpyruvate isomerase family mycothiol-dependent enzyme [Frankia sp. AgB32]